jgi:hypothetical protein
VTHVFVVEEAERKTTSTGKPYARAKVTGLGWASIWDGNDGNLVLSNTPGTFKGELIEKDGFKNLQGLEIASGQEATQAKKDGMQKDSEDWLRRLYISHLSNLTQVLEPGVGWDFYEKQVIRKARMYATADLLWIRGGGTEVPFS